MFASFRNDIRYALRQLRKSPGFTLTAALTLAVGIGATTAIFSLIWSVMLKPLPVAHPEQLYKIGSKNMCCTYGGMQGDWGVFSNNLYEYLRDHTAGFESLAAFQSGMDTFSVRRHGDREKAEAAQGRYVSGNYFSTLGAPVLRGRALTTADDCEGAPPAAVISYRYWRERFALDPSIIGGSLLMNGKGVTIVGVTPPGFYGVNLKADPPSFWIPVHQEVNLTLGEQISTNPDRHWLDVVGRIAPGTDIKRIDAELNVELKQWLRTRVAIMTSMGGGSVSEALPRQWTELAPAAASANDIRDAYQKGLMLLLWAALAVLFIVCANVASLMLVRAAARRQQTAISIALGARRGEVIRQSLALSVLVALIGGVGALAVSYAVTNMMLSLAFRGSQYVPLDASPSWPILGFAFGVSLLTGILFGAVPAWLSSRAHPAEVLRGANRSSHDASARPQQVLVVLQAALSIVLLCAAGLLLRSLNNLEHQHFGFQTEGRVLVKIDLKLAGIQHENLDAFYLRLRERLGRIPGVTAVSYASYAPMTFDNWSTYLFFPGRPQPKMDGTNYGASYLSVGPDYFQAIGARILRGRPITEEDNNNSRHVAVVNEAFAKKYFNGDAIGQHFGVQPQLRSQFEIVGVAEDTKYSNPHEPTPPMFFLPIAQEIQVEPPFKPQDEWIVYEAGSVVLEFQGSAAGKEKEVRAALADVNPNLAPQYVHTFEEQVSRNLNGETLIARLTSLFGLTALILASIGLYGVTAYSVVRRTSEIGIRMALGADRMQVLRTVMRRAMGQVLLGLAVGIPLAWLAGHLLASHIYQVAVFDPLIVAVSVACLAAAAALAALLPARRAATVNPVEALRIE